MRIYRRIVMDMASGRVLEADACEFDGEVALCKGGGSSTTNTVDYGYNDRMATLSEEQQSWARDYYNLWQTNFKPLEAAQARANLDMLPQETALYKKKMDSEGSLLSAETGLRLSQIESEGGLLPLETALRKNQIASSERLLPLETDLRASQIDAAQSLLPLETALRRDQLETSRNLLPAKAGLYRKQLAAAESVLPAETDLYRTQLAAAKSYTNAATRGVDVNERMAMATADAASAWKDARSQTERAGARMGVNPNSGRFQGLNASMDTQKAAQLAGARTQARVGAEQENFERLRGAASGVRGGSGTMLQGIGMLGL